MGNRQRRGGVAGNDDDFGLPLGNEFAEQARHPLQQIGFFPVAVGKGRIIGHIDEAPVGHQHPSLAQYCQAANA